MELFEARYLFERTLAAAKRFIQEHATKGQYEPSWTSEEQLRSVIEYCITRHKYEAPFSSCMPQWCKVWSHLNNSRCSITQLLHINLHHC